MIGIIFKFGSGIVEVRVKENNVFFRTNPTQGFGDIDGIKLNKVGVLREFPDLKDKDNWQQEARKRFKEKIKQMKTEREKVEYIKEDLKKYGYEPYAEQIEGFRPKRL